MVYKFKEGKSYRGIDNAQTVGEEMERLRKENGGKLITENVVDAARNEASPLHPAFTWDDTKAAEEYRKFEARHLIKAIVVSVNGNQLPAFINVSINEKQDNEPINFYQSVAVIAKEPDQLESAISAAKSSLSIAERNLSLLVNLAPVRRKKTFERSLRHTQQAAEIL